MNEVAVLPPAELAPPPALEIIVDELLQTPLGPVYFDPGGKCYWVENSRGDWIGINESNLIRRLKAAGFSARRGDGQLISDADRKLIDIQTDCDVAYAGPLAGYFRGPHEVCGQRILVTASPHVIQPIEGAWPIIEKLLDNLLIDEVADQRPYLFGWLKFSRESLQSGVSRPGQALVLAGERECGKSLLQKIITEAVGGRVAKPYRYMTGGTDFNGELFAAEHLSIEDELSSRYVTKRRAFGARIKEFTVNEVQSFHPKHRQAMSLTPLWRLTISVNDEPENLLILPPIDESIADKLMLLRASKKPMPMSTKTATEKKVFWSTIMAEMPAFLDAVENFVVPADLKCERFGIRTFHHPLLLRCVDELSPEMHS